MYAIEAQNVTKIIRGRTILNNVSLCVEQGEAVGIAGRNGSGKSMFFKTVCGLILPTSGSVSVFRGQKRKVCPGYRHAYRSAGLPAAVQRLCKP